MKTTRCILLLILTVTLLQGAAQNGAPISEKIRAANFWMPSADLNLDGNPDITLPSDINGDFQKYINQLKALKITHVRIGGKDYDEDRMFSFLDLATVINWLRSHGFEVVVQAPIQPTMTIAQNAARTASYVTAMNTGTLLSYPVEHWAIGNEPDGSYASPYNTNSVIAAYTRSCSVAMKAVWPQIKVIGPTLSYYDFSKYDEFLAPAGSHANSIMGAGVNGSYIDIVSFNTYPIPLSVLQNTATATQSLIAHLRDNYQFATILNTITAKAVAANRTDVKIMVTEANISAEQDINNKGATGYGPGSFLGGQFWAEMMAISMEKGVESIMHWSVVEGTDDDPSQPDWITDIGLIGKEATGTNTNTPKLRPSYWHFKEMAAHFTGTFFPVSSISGTTNIKAWAARSEDRIAVMVLNQNAGNGNNPLAVRLNSNVTQPTSGIDVYFSNVITGTPPSYPTSTLNIQNQSSVLLLFDCIGNFVKRYDYTISNASSSTDTGFQPVQTGTAPLIGETFSFSANPTAIFFGQSTTITMVPSTYTYSWQGPGGNILTAGTGATVSLVACQGSQGICTYTFTATDPKGCSTTQEINIQDAGYVTGGGSGTDQHLDFVHPSVCGANNGSAKIDCGTYCSDINYQWDGGTAVTSNSIAGLSPGMHTVQINHTVNPIYSETWQFYVAITGTRPAIFAGFDRDEARFCWVPLEATPNYSAGGYQWFVGNSTVPITAARAFGVTHWLGEKYRVKYTDPSTGCTNEDWVFIGRDWQKPICVPTSFALGIVCTEEFNSTYRSTGITTETLSASTTINKNMYFDKILTVPAGVTLTIENCAVAFSPSAHIVVANGGGLVIETTYILPCGYMVYPYVYVGGENVWLSVRNSGIEGGVKGFQLSGTNSSVFENNVFARTEIGIDMDNCNQASISENLFYDVRNPIRVAGSNSGVYAGAIENNHFMLADTGMFIRNGNHSNLSVRCNTLEYSEYGIVSQATLSSFGTSSESPGNVFTSSSTNLNHQLHHDGNTITYYMSAQNSFNLSLAGSCDAYTGSSTNEPVCPGIGSKKRMIYNDIQSVAKDVVLQGYPNPTNGLMTFVCILPAYAGAATFAVYELSSGKKLLRQDISPGKPEFTLDLSRYSAGVLLGVLETSNGEKKYIKIIKAE